MKANIGPIGCLLATLAAGEARVLQLARDLERPGSKRSEALHELRTLGPDAALAIESLLCVVEEDVAKTVVAGGDSDLREAAQALSAIGPSIVPPIVSVFERPCGRPVGRRTTGRACRTTVRYEEDRAEYCVWVRLWLAEAVAGLEPDVLSDLLAQFRRPGSHRPYVAAAIGKLKGRAGRAVPALVQGLSDGDVMVAERCAYALGDIGRQAQLAVSTLQSLLASDDERLRSAAQDAIRRITSSVE